MSLDGLEWLTSAGATPFELTALAGRLRFLRGNWRPGWYPLGPTDQQLADMGLILQARRLIGPFSCRSVSLLVSASTNQTPTHTLQQHSMCSSTIRRRY